MTRPVIDTGDTTYGLLDSVPATTVKAGRLKGGMVLLDRDLFTPALIVDHKVRGSHGDAAYLVLDLDTRRYTTIRIHANTPVPVMAEPQGDTP